MKARGGGLALFFLAQIVIAEDGSLGVQARRYLEDLIRLDTTNPPGNETRAAEYLKAVVEADGIAGELLGADPARLNFLARLEGTGEARPLLLMAHTDVVPADASQWTAPPLGALVRDDFLYGRGAVDDKSLLAAELAVLLELKRRNVRLKRDVILLGEADEESGSTGIQWLIENAWPKIDAEFAVNEGGASMYAGPVRVFQVQTSEKVPTRVILTARGTAGHGSLPRADNAVVRLSRAIVRLADAPQPVRLNTTTRRYLTEMSKLSSHQWLQPLLPRLENGAWSTAAAAQIRERDPEIDAMLHTSVSPTMIAAGLKINVIPNTAEAHIDVRRLPDETQAEVMARFRALINDPAVEISPAPGQTMPPTEPSAMTTELYRSMQRIFLKSSPRGIVVPFMSRGATDGAFLRAKGMAVYGAPIFLRDGTPSRAHGNDERISLENLTRGTELLLQIVLDVAAAH